MFSSSIPFYLGVENKKYRLIVAINHALDELDEPGSIHIILFGSEREKADFESIVKNHLKSKLGYYNPNRIKIVKSDKQSDGDFEVSFVPVGGDPPSP